MKRPSQEKIKSQLCFDAATGVFTWLVSPAKAVKAGCIAGTLHPSGHRYISINGKSYPAHRLAWVYVHGRWPRQHLDHVDGNPDNNAIKNLRTLARTKNLQAARKARSDSTSGFLGVSFRNDNKKWQARIQRYGKSISLGIFNTPEEAHLVYLLYKNNF